MYIVLVYDCTAWMIANSMEKIEWNSSFVKTSNDSYETIVLARTVRKCSIHYNAFKTKHVLHTAAAIITIIR